MLKKHFWLLSMLKTVVLANICEKKKYIYFRIQEFSKEQHLFEIEIFCNIMKSLYCDFWSFYCVFDEYI